LHVNGTLVPICAKRFLLTLIDIGSNISCIDISLINDTELVKNEKDFVITGADNNNLEQLGKMKLVVKINGNTYSINTYVIKGLNCKILLGNDLNIKNNLIISFKDKNLELNNDVLISMEKLWYNYNIQSNYNNIGTEYNITSINYDKR